MVLACLSDVTSRASALAANSSAKCRCFVCSFRCVWIKPHVSVITPLAADRQTDIHRNRSNSVYKQKTFMETGRHTHKHHQRSKEADIQTHKHTNSPRTETIAYRSVSGGPARRRACLSVNTKNGDAREQTDKPASSLPSKTARKAQQLDEESEEVFHGEWPVSCLSAN